MIPLAWNDCRAQIRGTETIRPVGRVANLVGMVVEIAGLAAPVGALCRIEVGRNRAPILCEAIGFRDDTLLVMPLGKAEGIAAGQPATLISTRLSVPVGDGLLGRIVDGLGRPLDGGPPLTGAPHAPLDGGRVPAALTRRRTGKILPTGLRAIDAVLTVARGQRMGIFAGSGVGKSILLGMLARQAEVDVSVLALIGERGREVREFVERDLGPEGLARSVVVVVTSDESAVMRAKGAETAMTIAERFREADRHVLFLMDSATRYAMALREIGLAAGEPPTTKGYPPSVFAALPRLCERAGSSAINAMTAFFTVLIEGDDIHDPVGEAMRAILDGHLFLSRDLARRGHYPAVDVLGSISRLRNEIVPAQTLVAAKQVLQWLEVIEQNRDLVSIGAYAAGSDPLLDTALAKQDAIRQFLTQGVDEGSDLHDTLDGLNRLTGGTVT